MIAMMLYFGRALYAKAAVEDTASVGARWAATSLSGEQGCRQSRQALTTVLQGYYLNPAGAHVTVRPVGAWGRGARAEVLVTYNVSQRGVPILGPLLGDSIVRSHYLVPIDAFNSRYDDAWRACL
jgi:Flp pilus assembly protein TadG